MAKQVIVIRTNYTSIEGKPFGLRKGKIAAQVGHAVLKVFVDRMIKQTELDQHDGSRLVPSKITYSFEATPAMEAWLDGIFTKICVSVNSEKDLMEIKTKADDAGIPNALIIDSGSTEFHGVPTTTCIALGPDDEEKIDKITGKLPLL